MIGVKLWFLSECWILFLFFAYFFALRWLARSLVDGVYVDMIAQKKKKKKL